MYSRLTWRIFILIFFDPQTVVRNLEAQKGTFIEFIIVYVCECMPPNLTHLYFIKIVSVVVKCIT